MSVLVFCELKDGKLKKTSREALAIGRSLARSSGGELREKPHEGETR